MSWEREELMSQQKKADQITYPIESLASWKGVKVHKFLRVQAGGKNAGIF